MPTDKVLLANISRHMSTLCTQIGERHLGSTGERKSADYIAAQFERYGYSVVRESFEAPGWRYGAYNLTMRESGRKLQGFPCYYSNACDIHGKVKTFRPADVNTLSAADVSGKMCFYLCETEAGNVEARNQVAERLDELGAGALIVISCYQDTVNTKIVRTPDLKRLGVMCVSGDTAVEIAHNMRCTFHLKIEAENFPTQASNIIARVKGRGAKKVVIGAHYDTSPGIPGASDNASGTALLLESARLLKDRCSDYSVDFVAFGGEEYGGKGCGIGAHEYFHSHRDEVESLEWMCNFDSIGFHLGETYVSVGRSDRIRECARKAVVGHALAVGGYRGGSDENIFHEHGIPTIRFYTSSRYKQVHSPKDALCTIDVGILCAVAETGVSICECLFSE